MARKKKLPATPNTPAVPPVKRKPGRPPKATLASTLRERATFHTKMADAYLAVAKLEEGRS